MDPGDQDAAEERHLEHTRGVVRNPPPLARLRSIVFVCQGSIRRSRSLPRFSGACSRFAAHRHKIMLLSLYDPALEGASPYGRFHISDLHAKSAEVFDTCFSRIERTLAALATRAHNCTT